LDLTSVLPLLMQQKGGKMNDRTAELLQAFSSMRQGAETAQPNAAGGIMDMLTKNGAKPQGDAQSPAALLQMLAPNQNLSPQLNLVNLLSTMGKNGRSTKKPYGLAPVKAFIPDLFLGRLVKFFG